MLGLSDLVALGLAGGAITDVWFNGSIFAEARAYFEARDSVPAELLEDQNSADTANSHHSDSDHIEQPKWMQVLDKIVPDWMVELFLCKFCFSHHAVLWPAVLLLLPAALLPWPASIILRMPLYWLAGVKIITTLREMAEKEHDL